MSIGAALSVTRAATTAVTTVGTVQQWAGRRRSSGFEIADEALIAAAAAAVAGVFARPKARPMAGQTMRHERRPIGPGCHDSLAH